MANIINAIINMVSSPVTMLASHYQTNNRANSLGEALEKYVIDLFADSIYSTEEERLKKTTSVFSYFGNSNNPPDGMLKGGDAIEVKKIMSSNSAIALNSSYPKQYLFADNKLITHACKTAEDWQQKDMLYVTGNVDKQNNIRHICMVYGKDYCAADEVYSRVKLKIKDGVESIPNIEFAETNELGKINKIDPLGATYLRVRGMWGIENPWKVFSYIYERDMDKDFTFMCIINETKWSTLKGTEKLLALEEAEPNLCIKDVQIKDPDNPAKLRKAKLITFFK
jgi:hypothetical protein